MKFDSSRRLLVELDPFEAELLDRLYRDLCRYARSKGGKVPDKKKVVAGCIRTAIHAVYGEEYVYEGLLSDEEFRTLMEKVRAPVER